MKNRTFTVENLKCGGCELTVRKLLLDIEGISSVTASADSGIVDFQFEGPDSIGDLAIKRLHKAGYAPIGKSSLRDRAVSYVSCMKGKLSKD